MELIEQNITDMRCGFSMGEDVVIKIHDPIEIPYINNPTILTITPFCLKQLIEMNIDRNTLPGKKYVNLTYLDKTFAYPQDTNIDEVQKSVTTSMLQEMGGSVVNSSFTDYIIVKQLSNPQNSHEITLEQIRQAHCSDLVLSKPSPAKSRPRTTSSSRSRGKDKSEFSQIPTDISPVSQSSYTQRSRRSRKVEPDEKSKRMDEFTFTKSHTQMPLRAEISGNLRGAIEKELAMNSGSENIQSATESEPQTSIPPSEDDWTSTSSIPFPNSPTDFSQPQKSEPSQPKTKSKKNTEKQPTPAKKPEKPPTKVNSIIKYSQEKVKTTIKPATLKDNSTKTSSNQNEFTREVNDDKNPIKSAQTTSIKEDDKKPQTSEVPHKTPTLVEATRGIIPANLQPSTQSDSISPQSSQRTIELVAGSGQQLLLTQQRTDAKTKKRRGGATPSQRSQRSQSSQRSQTQKSQRQLRLDAPMSLTGASRAPVSAFAVPASVDPIGGPKTVANLSKAASLPPRDEPERIAARAGNPHLLDLCQELLSTDAKLSAANKAKTQKPVGAADVVMFTQLIPPDEATEEEFQLSYDDNQGREGSQRDRGEEEDPLLSLF